MDTKVDEKRVKKILSVEKMGKNRAKDRLKKNGQMRGRKNG